MRSMLDLMPAPGLIFNEWKKHGTCSGLGPRPYFETIRKARAAVKIPPEFLKLSDPKTIPPSEIEDAFIKANPGLATAAISVTCNRTRLSEVRICMSKDLQFRACEELERRGCRRDQVRCRRCGAAEFAPSCPRSASDDAPGPSLCQNVDGRDKPGHDG